MNTWWKQRTPRERGLLIGGILLTGVVLIYIFIWEPFVTRHRRLRQTVAEQRADLAWMQQAARDLQHIQQGTRTRGEGRSLLTVVDQTARVAGLGPALKQLTPQGDAQLSARLEAAEFDKMLYWIEVLEREHPIVLLHLRVERTESSGRVNARVLLQRARS